MNMAFLEQITVNIVPTPCLTNKAAEFMDTRTTASRTVACNKLDFGMIRVNDDVTAHVQAQPFGGVIWRCASWAGAGMPRRHKVVAAVQHKGTVA